MTGFDSKRSAAQGKLDDEADTLTIVYQQGFADGKRAAQPEQEPSQWRDMVVVSLVREGINKHKARELADHFATPPAAQPEPALEPKHMVQSNGRHSSLLTHMMNKRTAPPQRQWQGLTASTILNLMPSSIPADHDGPLMEFARAIEAAHNIKEGT